MVQQGRESVPDSLPHRRLRKLQVKSEKAEVKTGGVRPVASLLAITFNF
jgi:hypothetical protein